MPLLFLAGFARFITIAMPIAPINPSDTQIIIISMVLLPSLPFYHQSSL